jgi:hypothetical protein
VGMCYYLGSRSRGKANKRLLFGRSCNIVGVLSLGKIVISILNRSLRMLSHRREEPRKTVSHPKTKEVGYWVLNFIAKDRLLAHYSYFKGLEVLSSGKLVVVPFVMSILTFNYNLM